MFKKFKNININYIFKNISIKKNKLTLFKKIKINILKKNFHTKTFRKKIFLNILNKIKKSKYFYFFKIQMRNKLLPDIYLTKNFKKLKSFNFKRAVNYKLYNNVSNFFLTVITEKLKPSIHIYINHRFIFKFLKKFSGVFHMFSQTNEIFL